MRNMLDTNICIYLIKNHLPQVLRRLATLPLGSVVISVVTYAELRAAVRDRSRNALDRLIAARAVNSGFILVINTEANFKDYPGLFG